MPSNNAQPVRTSPASPGNGRLPSRVGNRDPELVPHGVYPAAGDDRWVAIAVDGDPAFLALCTAMGRPALARDPRFASPEARRAHETALDEALAAWTRTHDAAAIEGLLQAHGVAASAVQDSAALCTDPQLAHRGHFLPIPHPKLGTTTIETTRFHLSRTPASTPEDAPTYGRDTATVLSDLLGYDEARITELVRSGALE